MSSKLIECPRCIGTGEEVYNKKKVKQCSTCKGHGMVDEHIAEAFIGEELIY